ncbi:MAG: hypothetical protein JST00_39230 [Deltaproteobacteria bacterium]|nr:hypothetical protein [Deltaproteobacteria bacterium]
MAPRLLLALVPLALLSVHCAAPSETDDAAEEGTSADEIKKAESLFGNFSSKQCEPVDAETWERREYHFGVSSSTASWIRYASADCSEASKTMTIDIEGGAKITGFSLELRAVELVARFDKKTITPTAKGLSILAEQCKGYAFRAGAPTEVGDGCGKLLRQEDRCPAEYDLMKVTLRGLYFGDRGRPLCSEQTRPSKVARWPVTMD